MLGLDLQTIEYAVAIALVIVSLGVIWHYTRKLNKK